MIYNNNNRELNEYFLNEVKNLLGEKRVLLHEYYERVDDAQKDAHILKGMEVQVYKLDRTTATPHVHLIDGDIEIEVSLIDWRIINVKNPQNITNDWSNFVSIRKRFFKWLEDNYEKLFDEWNKNNPDNQVDNYFGFEKNTSVHLKKYINNHENPISISAFKKDIYGTLSPLFSVKETKNKLKDLDIIALLKEIGLFDEWHLKETNIEALKAAEDAVNDVKIWFSYI